MSFPPCSNTNFLYFRTVTTISETTDSSYKVSSQSKVHNTRLLNSYLSIDLLCWNIIDVTIKKKRNCYQHGL